MVSCFMRKSFQTGLALFAPPELPLHPAMKGWGGLEALMDWGEGKAATGWPGYPALMLFRAALEGAALGGWMTFWRGRSARLRPST
jgi:hypothetical protein